jgi:16S rRNA (cytidine1402-2'-O)-methyltransferase
MNRMINLEKGLYIVSTPIGNLDDLSFRAKKILDMVDFIICENPIHSLKLLNKLGIKKKMFSLHDYNEDILIKRIEKYQNNSSIALISDAGSPLISDPGYNLVKDFIKKKLKITTLPGPSSIISALQLSGLPINSFEFHGFVPKNKSGIMSLVRKIENLKTTSVFFISGNRLLIFLESLCEMKMGRDISVCKEITKKNEKVFRGNSGNIIEKLSEDINNYKGEFVIVIEGNMNNSKKSLDRKIEEQITKLLKKFSLTDAVDIVHKLSNISKKEIYNSALLLKND